MFLVGLHCSNVTVLLDLNNYLSADIVIITDRGLWLQKNRAQVVIKWNDLSVGGGEAHYYTEKQRKCQIPLAVANVLLP